MTERLKYADCKVSHSEQKALFLWSMPGYEGLTARPSFSSS